MSPEEKEAFFDQLNKGNSQFRHSLPSRKDTAQYLQALVDYLFPSSSDCECRFASDRNQLHDTFEKLSEQLECLLNPIKPLLNDSVNSTVGKFNSTLPEIYEKLLEDARSIADNDPASSGIEEVVGIYPGFMAIATYRIAHSMAGLKVPFLPRMLTEYAHSQTGIDIHPHARIGRHFFIDHGTGIVIGETAEIGNHVKIYQGVTLGATHVSKSMAATKRHPTIEDNVVIYANAIILGGDTVIGHDTVVGGNAWVTRSIPPYSQVYQRSAVEVRTHQPA
jgi:serine O-acetyltransferase